MKIIKLAKVTTEDCVAWIIQNYAPDTKPSDWKRRSKTKQGNVIVRLFENANTGVTYNVYEQNGAIVSSPAPNSQPNPAPSVKHQPKQKKIYYVIARSNTGLTGGRSEKPIALLYVTDSDEFDRVGYQSDETPNGTFEELERLGYYGAEHMESVIEIMPLWTKDMSDVNAWMKRRKEEPPIDIEELKRKLATSNVFQFSPAFQRFMMRDREEMDDEIVPI
jgi:hypothetical protein